MTNPCIARMNPNRILFTPQLSSKLLQSSLNSFFLDLLVFICLLLGKVAARQVGTADPSLLNTYSAHPFTGISPVLFPYFLQRADLTSSGIT